MTKAKTTKRALLMSVISMLLCVSMLVGSTFAWFTDSVTSGTNRIVAGNLDVELYYKNASTEGKWKDASKEKTETPNFFVDKDGKAILWEPGVMAVTQFKVANVGSLALKYSLETVKAGFNSLGGHDLSEVIQFAVIDNDKYTAGTTTRDDILALDPKFDVFTSFKAEGQLLPEAKKTESEPAEKIFTVVAYWEPNVKDDNLYNVNNGQKTDDGADQLYIDIEINLTAAQATVESDSFDNQYDRVAALIQDGYAAVETSEELADALKEGKNVVLTGDVRVATSVLKAAEGTVIDGNGNKLIGLGTDNEHQGLQLAKNVEYRNIVFELEKGWGVITKSAEFYNCTFNAASPYLSPAEGDDIVVDGCTLVNTLLQICYNEGGRNPASAKTIITNNKFIVNNTNERAHAIAIGGGSPEFWASGAETVTMTGNTFTPNNADTSYIAYYIYGDYGTTLTSVPVYKDNTYNGEACYAINSTEESNRHPLKVKVASSEELLEALKDGGMIELTEGEYTLPSYQYTLPAGTSIIGDGNTVLVVDGNKASDDYSQTSNYGMLISGDDVTIKDVTLSGENIGSNEYDAFVKIKGDNVTLENVTINSDTNSSPIVISSTASDDNTITIKDCNITAAFKAIHIVDGTRGTINIEGCNIDAVYPFNVNTNSKLKLAVKDSVLNGWTSYGPSVISVEFDNCQFGEGHGQKYIAAYTDTVFTNCTFNGTQIGAYYQSKGTFNFDFTNCSKNGNLITADNFKSMFDDSDIWNKCSCIVNEKAVAAD